MILKIRRGLILIIVKSIKKCCKKGLDKSEGKSVSKQSQAIMYVDMTEMCVIISNTMLFRNKKIDILILHEKQGQAKPRAREELSVED